MLILTDKYFKTVFWVAKSHTAVCFKYFLSMVIFSTDISQGSIATCLRWGAYLNMNALQIYLLSLTVKEFGKSVNTWSSYEV